MENMQREMCKSIGGRDYVIEDMRVRKFSQIPVNVPHEWVCMDRNPTRYGSFVVEVQNKDTNEIYRCYMPKYLAERGSKGKIFVYEGLKKKTDGSGHSFHKVVFLKQRN